MTNGSEFDPTAMVRLQKYGRELILEIVELYLREFGIRLAQMCDAVQLRDAASLGDAAHALKGCSSNVGALGVINRCLVLEEAARRGDFTAAAEIVKLIESQLTPITTALNRSAAPV